MVIVDREAFRKCLLDGVRQNGSVDVDARIFESNFKDKADISGWLKVEKLDWIPFVRLFKKNWEG